MEGPIAIAHLIGTSAAIRAVEEEIGYAAQTSSKVLITGESGVGKEVVARMIHRASGRGHGPLVTINCAGVPDTLLESELFGHLRGSFTGAYRDKPGLLETAHGGTIFMDEVGEMSLRMQALLLRFLESGEIQSVGADRPKTRADVRVIAATNRRLLDRIATKEFREDLYYRLNVIHVVVPALRERREDIGPLFAHFLEQFAAQHRLPAPKVAPDALRQLEAYSWPGNVRELRNLAERLIVRGPRSSVTCHDLPVDTAVRATVAGTPAAASRDTIAAQLFDRMVHGRESFWTAVYPAFMSRDLTRDDMRELVSRGLEQAHGSYKIVVELFNMRPEDYKRFLNFLKKHSCHMPFHQFRSAAVRVVREKENAIAFAGSAVGGM
jgi:transcriptional regulator with PAS, ATPase and Fis domain